MPTARELLESQVDQLTVNGHTGGWKHVAEVAVVHGSLGFRIWGKKHWRSDSVWWKEPHEISKVWIKTTVGARNRLLMRFDPPILLQPGECFFVPVFDADEAEGEVADV